MKYVRAWQLVILLLSWHLSAALPAAEVGLSPRIDALRAFADRIDLQRGGNQDARLSLVLDNKFQPRPGVPAWSIAPPIAWDSDPFADPNWRFQLHAWRMLDPLILAYLRNPRSDLLDRMLAIAADWKRYHLDEGRSSEFANYDMALGLRAQKLAWLWLALDHGGRDVERDTLVAPLAQAALETLLAQRPFSDNNHGLFQVHGLLALCKAGVHAAGCIEALPAALTGFQRLLNQQFGSDFAHVEHSPAYHFFALRTFERMRASGWYDGADAANAILDGARAVSPWLIDPAGNLFPVGDSDSASGPALVPDERHCVLTLATTCYVLKAFPATGWAVARSDWHTEATRGSAVFLQAAHHSATHKHADDLSFIWFDRGRSVLVDPGRFAYVVDPVRDYMISTRAHNAVEIGGRNQVTGNAGDAGILAATVEGDTFFLSGHALHARTSTRQRREIYYRPQQALIVIDRLSSPAAQTSTHWFQFAQDATMLPGSPDGSQDRVVSLDPGGRLHVLLAREDCTITEYRGETAHRLQGWITTGYAQAAPALSLAVRCGDAVADTTVGVAFVWQDADPDRIRREMQHRMREDHTFEPRPLPADPFQMQDTSR